MSKGTITLTNQSSSITGLNTSFIDDIAAGDMVVAVVGGVTYTLPVKSVESNTSLTLIKNYDGPLQSNVAWVAVPRDTLNQITAQLSAEAAKALRGLNYDKSNWQMVFSEHGDITITLPDGSVFSGPSWLKIAEQYTASYRLKVGEIISSAFRKEDLGEGWYLANGDKYAITSPQGQALRSLPVNYKTDWGVVESDGFINLPNVFNSSTGYGYFPRFADGIKRRIGSTQGDAIRNIIGSFVAGVPIGHSKYATGAFLGSGGTDAGNMLTGTYASLTTYGYSINVSKVVPTADENRPSNIGFTPAIYLGI